MTTDRIIPDFSDVPGPQRAPEWGPLWHNVAVETLDEEVTPPVRRTVCLLRRDRGFYEQWRPVCILAVDHESLHESLPGMAGGKPERWE